MRHDPQLKAVMNAYTLPIVRASWAVDPTGCRDEVVQLVADDVGLPILGHDDKPGPARRRGVIWTRHIAQAARAHLVYGHMVYERRYRIDKPAPGGCRLDNLGPRMPWTFAQIRLNPDATVMEVQQSTQYNPIPAPRLVWYANEQEGANWAGVSMLRPAFGAWLLKHDVWRTHATSIRRFGMGVPAVEAPAGATAAMVAEAQALAANMRAGDSTGAGLPQGFKFHLTGLTGSVPDALAFIRYLDQAMAKMVLAGLIELGQTETGSRALGDSFLDLFLLSLQGVADELATVATSGWPGMPGIVTDLVDQNWGDEEPAPRIVCTDVGEDYAITAESLGKLAQFGALSPDPTLDAWIRERWRMPRRDTPWQPTSRGIPAPGAPGGPVPGPAGEPPATTAAGKRGAAAAAGAGGLRRKMTAQEVAAGFQPAAHQRAWQTAVAALTVACAPVVAGWKTDLVDQVEAAVRDRKPDRLSALAVDVSDAVKVISEHMAAAAADAATAVRAEAAAQGVNLPPAAVPAGRLSAVAAARATFAAAALAGAAGHKALQVQAGSRRRWGRSRASLMDEALRTGGQVATYLDGLAGADLAGELGAALTAAQAAGRGAVLEAAPESAGQATYLASEILDGNICGPCSDVDGTTYATYADAEGAYPTGGYLDCASTLRCRGTVLALWGGQGG